LLLLKTGSAQHRPALSRLEGNCSLGSALPTGRSRLWTSPGRTAGALRLALLAALGVVRKLLVVKEELLARGENKIGAAIDTL
jgi:hypothetical protein